MVVSFIRYAEASLLLMNEIFATVQAETPLSPILPLGLKQETALWVKFQYSTMCCSSPKQAQFEPWHVQAWSPAPPPPSGVGGDVEKTT